MIILTCANSATARNYERGDEEYKGFSFRSIIEATARKAQACGYTPVVFDLGTLGIGERYTVEDRSFAEKGYYDTEVIKGYKSKSLFKPELVELVMGRHDDVVVYLDGDAQLVGSLDDVRGGDYDVGVTVRPTWETVSEWHRQHVEIVKYLNAGVVFLNPTDAARRFVSRWRVVTEEVGNDQMALNRLACPARHPPDYAIEVIDGIRIKYFPCLRYNFYFFGDRYPLGARVLHFKGDVRQYYPFTWRARARCLVRSSLSRARHPLRADSRSC